MHLFPRDKRTANVSNRILQYQSAAEVISGPGTETTASDRFPFVNNDNNELVPARFFWLNWLVMFSFQSKTALTGRAFFKEPKAAERELGATNRE